jgi:hypothetical protein
VPGNSRPVRGYDFSGTYDKVAQMRDYDRLPVTVRRALDVAPFEICCVATLAYYRQHNASLTIAEIADSARLYLQAAERETGVPRCRLPLRTSTRSSSRSTRAARTGSDLPARVRRRLRLPASALTVPTVAG